MLNYKTLLFGILILCGFVGWIRIGGTGAGHLADSQCQECHLSEQVTPDRARMLISSQEKLCVKCHPKAIQLSHPSGFIPRRILPETFPVDWKGELTCSSCHLIHGNKPGLMRSEDKGAVFCLKCHDKEFFERMPDHGESMTISGHLDAREGDSSRPSVDLDVYSLQCLGCHDEKVGDAPMRVGMDRSGIMHHGGASLSHPLGRSYAQAAKSGGYRPAIKLPEAVLLPDGNVGCVSCHQGYSKKHGGLTVDNRGSALCLTCHDL
ncbi:MAG: cytochrome c3 family protein [Magnetococcales bacterium]|nr:cytochrome c3 family protein [Magnetococcales bacterium]MBF0438813.1 cytochrome c3 family protein [Magnetococcales bacterium]